MTFAAAPLRVVGDVHGDLRGFRHALATSRFVLQLGDLVDYGPDSAGVLRLMLDRAEAGGGGFLLGNHELRLARALAGRAVRPDEVLERTLAGMDAALRTRAAEAFAQAPLWLRRGAAVFVHGGFHPAMLEGDSPVGAPFQSSRLGGVASRALYGEVTGRIQADGFAERSLRWVERIPHGVTVYCGHDRRSSDGRPYRRVNERGGTAVFLDTGAGKGGHLAWIDLEEGGAAT